LINQVHSAAQFIRSLDQGRDHLRILFQFGLRKCFDIRRSDAYIELHAPVPAAAHPISVEPPEILGMRTVAGGRAPSAEMYGGRDLI
jgi:hypothetical protein